MLTRILENGRTEDEINSRNDLKDISDWEIPKVSFVEAMEIYRHWAQPIYSDMMPKRRNNSEPLRDNDLEFLGAYNRRLA